ncbi:MAG: chemotaxis protein CheB [Halieaceae bacterium]
MQDEPLIGLICDHSSPVLAGYIGAAGYRLVRVMPDKLSPQDLAPVDVWVIDCEDSNVVADAAAWLEPQVLAISNRPKPALLEDYRAWCDKIIHTLDKWTADIRHAHLEQSRSDAAAYAAVEGVWVLAGSTGAVAAVSRFLGAFTHVPPVAFVYAQHIHHSQQASLKAIGHANRDLVCNLAIGRHWLNPGHVLIAPATSQLRFSRFGEVFSVRDQWETSETPCIDKLMLAISGLKPAPSGAIIFSGAGRDSCLGLHALQAVGTEIWAQSPESCEAPSMPQAAIDDELASTIATPEAMAAMFMQRYPTGVA